MAGTRSLPPPHTGHTCRCAVDVSCCERGCTLLACCGGYVREGHMSDCTSPGTLLVYGRFSRPSLDGEG